MSYTSTIFFLFGALSSFSAYLAISQKNSIHALCSLIFVFVCSAFMMFFVNADFLAFTYIIVYVGAISVFFLFAVMLLDLKSDETMKQMIAYLPLHILFIFSNWYIIHKKIMETPWLVEPMNQYVAPLEYTTVVGQTDILKLGHALYFEFGPMTIGIGGLLFLSMVGVICLTFEYAKSFTKRQYVYEQHAASHTVILTS